MREFLAIALLLLVPALFVWGGFIIRAIRRKKSKPEPPVDIDPPVAAPGLTRSQVDEFSRKVTGKGGN